MKEDSFFITLMSNSSTQVFGDNKTSSFTVLLPEKITLNGKWCVALAEMHYNFNFFNITRENNGIYVKEKSNKTDSGNHIVKHVKKNGEIAPGYYTSIYDVVTIINKELKKLSVADDDILSYNKFNGRTNIFRENVKNNIDAIQFDTRLSMQLGFEPDDVINRFVISPYCTNIHFGIPDQMIIYIDIIEPSFIGHEKAYVLEIVNTQPRLLSFGDACYKEFHQLHYMSLQKREFESISVDIRDCSGNLMPFLHGILTLKLHFKKQNG